MRLTTRLLTLTAALVVLILPLRAQTREGLMADLLKDIGQVEKKVMGLARAMPDPAWGWRPGAGVRSTGEVFMHVAADNYFMPVLMGVTAPTETGITKEYDTAAAFEKRTMSRDAVIAEVEKSFAFLKKSLTDTPDARLNEPIEFFGQKSTSRGLAIAATTHLHEHLGQLIAYARSNNVTPPWSK
jgi:uncharacterized damage-inducible protein DinB